MFDNTVTDGILNSSAIYEMFAADKSTLTRWIKEGAFPPHDFTFCGARQWRVATLEQWFTATE